MDAVDIRRLTSRDAALYRDIRLAALKESPEAFAGTFEAENGQPLAWFSDRLAGNAIFGAIRDGTAVGIAGLLIQEGEKKAHKGVLFGMYVRPEARRLGIGARLCEAVVDLARRQVEIVQLHVVSDNQPARRLYARLGFIEYGLEKKAMKRNGRYYDEVLMAMDLRP